MKNKTMTISIPADNEGYVLMKCPQCGELFRLKVHDIHDDGVMNIHCPACFFASYYTNDFITDDVQQHVEALVRNYAGEVINEMMKELEKSLRACFKIRSSCIIMQAGYEYILVANTANN